MLNIFNFHGKSIRFINGKPVGIDVAEVLGYADSSSTISKKVKPKYRSLAEMATEAGTRMVTVLEEAGIYQLIVGSKLESAEEFQDWLFEEVLPSIRKTGSYSISKDDILDKVLNALEKSGQRLEENEKGFKQAMSYISVLEEEKFDREFYLEKINEITKEHPLFKSLIELKMLIKLNSYSFPSLDYSIRDLSLLFMTTKITPRDLAFYSSHLYFLDYGEKPRKKEGHYTYNGKDLIYPLLVLFRLEGFSWEDLRNSLEIDYLIKFPTSNRGFLPQGN
jgi:prophage antirepressor-like protein